jgi:glycosyltransferase involved in cell wall biosynthesis
LKETLNSLVSQSYKDFEVIVMDNNSTDKTQDIVMSYVDHLDIIFIQEQDDGMYDAIQKGFSRSNGNVLCYLNSDDRYLHQTLMSVYEEFISTNAELIFGDMYIDNGTYFRKVIYPRVNSFFFQSAEYSLIGQPSAFWTRKAYFEVGEINGDYKMAGDYDLFCRLISRRTIKLNNILSIFRLHPQSLTSNFSINSKKEMDIIRKQYNKNWASILIGSKIAGIYFKLVNLGTRFEKIKDKA